MPWRSMLSKAERCAGGNLLAIRCRFAGAITYVGNGPNFLVKSIAEHRGVAMPSFTGYMLCSTSVLIPLFLAVTVLFF